MKLGKIYTYENASEARKLIGKRVYYSDNLRLTKECESKSLDMIKDDIGTLKKIGTAGLFPFNVDIFHYQFIREVIEEEKTLMTNKQLSEWLAKGNGERKFVRDNVVCREWLYMEKDKNLSVDGEVRIRPWDSDEWVKPTVDIYERDCKGIRRIE